MTVVHDEIDNLLCQFTPARHARSSHNCRWTRSPCANHFRCKQRSWVYAYMHQPSATARNDELALTQRFWLIWQIDPPLRAFSPRRIGACVVVGRNNDPSRDCKIWPRALKTVVEPLDGGCMPIAPVQSLSKILLQEAEKFNIQIKCLEN